jgi:hypothetical protein
MIGALTLVLRKTSANIQGSNRLRNVSPTNKLFNLSYYSLRHPGHYARKVFDEKNDSSNIIKPFHASIDSYLKSRTPKPSNIASIATAYDARPYRSNASRLATYPEIWSHTNPSPTQLASCGFCYFAEFLEDACMCHVCDIQSSLDIPA